MFTTRTQVTNTNAYDAKRMINIKIEFVSGVIRPVTVGQCLVTGRWRNSISNVSAPATERIERLYTSGFFAKIFPRCNRGNYSNRGNPSNHGNHGSSVTMVTVFVFVSYVKILKHSSPVGRPTTTRFFSYTRRTFILH